MTELKAIDELNDHTTPAKPQIDPHDQTEEEEQDDAHFEQAYYWDSKCSRVITQV